MIYILGEGPVPIGRGSVRGQRLVDVTHFRAPRPESSMGASGKQGKNPRFVIILIILHTYLLVSVILLHVFVHLTIFCIFVCHPIPKFVSGLSFLVV